MQLTPVLLPGKSHGWRSMVGYSPWGRKESDTTEDFTFFLSFIIIEPMRSLILKKYWRNINWVPKHVLGIRHGNPLQYSCLENFMDSGAWQATVHGATKSWTWLSTPSTTTEHVQSIMMNAKYKCWIKWAWFLLLWSFQSIFILAKHKKKKERFMKLFPPVPYLLIKEERKLWWKVKSA